MNLQFTSVSSTGSSTNAISFNEARGTFNAGSGTLSNATGNTVNITGNGVNDDLAFTYGGAISDDGNLLVNITGQTGGTKTFGGTLTDGAGAGGGITVARQHRRHGQLQRPDDAEHRRQHRRQSDQQHRRDDQLQRRRQRPRHHDDVAAPASAPPAAAR